jgi:hypothetical protein
MGFTQSKKWRVLDKKQNLLLLRQILNGNTDSKNNCYYMRQITASNQITYAELNPALVKNPAK